MSSNAVEPLCPEVVQAFQEIQSLAQNRSSERIGRLLEHCRPYLLAIAEAELPSGVQGKVGASDLVQDTLARGVEHLDQFEGQTPEELAKWLRRILLNHLSDVRRSFRTDKRDVVREQPPGSSIVDAVQLAPSGVVALREDEQRLEAALRRLPSDYQTVIRLRHQDDCSFAEIGAAMSRSEDAAGKLWARAVQRLQEELQ